MTPQVVNAGKIRMHYPTSKSADEHFENLRREFADGLQKLRALVDDAINTSNFIKATGNYLVTFIVSNNYVYLPFFRRSITAVHCPMRRSHKT